MSADEGVAMIHALAETLAVPAQQVLVYYMARIPALWIQVGVWFATALVLLAALGSAIRVIRARRIEWERRQESNSTQMYLRPSFDAFFDGSAVAAIVSVASGVFLFVAILVGMTTLQRAISATVAPEAYAIDAVLRQLRGSD